MILGVVAFYVSSNKGIKELGKMVKRVLMNRRNILQNFQNR
jgi:hypothetical protein